MSVSQILVILLRRAWIVVLTLLTTVIVAGGVLLFVPGRYDAVATASIDPGNIDPLSDMGGGLAAMGLIQGNILSLVGSQRVAVDVVKRLNLTDNPAVQQNFRKSPSFGRESIEEWMAAGLARNVDPKFTMGTNVLAIRYKSGDPNQAALIANAFLAATIDGSVAMKAAEADQTARWFAPQLDELRKELEEARVALQAFQTKTNMVAPSAAGGDRETSQYMAIAQELSSARAGLTVLQSRLTGGSTDLSNDPSDPDLQILAGLKEKLSTAETENAASKGVYGANNPKMVAQQTNLATLRKQIGDATDKMRVHLKERIALSQTQIASLEAEQDKAQKSLIEVQAQRDRLNQLQRDVTFRADELNGRQRTAEQARVEEQADIFGYDGPGQGVAPCRSGVSKAVCRDAGRDWRRPRARADPGPPGRSGGSASSLSNRSGACGPGAVLGRSRQRGTRQARIGASRRSLRPA